MIDVDAAKQLEATVRFQSELLGAVGQAVIAVDLDRIVLYWNRAAEELYGWSAEEAVGKRAPLLADGEAVPRHAKETLDVMGRGGTWSGDCEVARRDGSSVSVFVTFSPIFGPDGRITAVIGASIDITARLAALRALKSEYRLAEAQRTAHLGSFEFDLVTGRLSWSEEYFRILGIDPSVPPSISRFNAAVHPDDRRVAGQVWVDALQRGRAFDHEFRIVRPDAEVRTVRARVEPEVDDSGTVVLVAGTMIDDTERSAADAVRRAAETRFEFGFEQAAIGTVIVGLDGIPLRVNPAVCALLGRPADLLVGRRWTEYSHPDDVSLADAVLARLAAGHDTYEDERRFVWPDGTVVWASTHVSLVRDEDGEPLYIFGQLQDITARKRRRGTSPTRRSTTPSPASRTGPC
ncbi:MAG: PAS domain S-box protein [Acidimicrobiia bacterium]|nr:PAS domain S-box protein [Acidimicrobiia bacterium]